MNTSQKYLKPYPSPEHNKTGNKEANSIFWKESRETRLESNSRVDEVVTEHLYGSVEISYIPSKFTYDDTKKSKYSFVAEVNSKGKKAAKITEKIKPYIPPLELQDLIKLAQIVQRPILLKGEPGVGKTLLSKSVAVEWYAEKYRQHYFEWHIKSTSKAIDGKYTYDHIARLRDAQVDQNGKDNPPLTQQEQQEKDKKYRSFGPLAQALLSSKKGNPSILLIDEIDKADIDFPNDLLLELDELRFNIPETGEEVSCKEEDRPIIFITSNDERELPEAFLRRCLFAYLEFPEDEGTLKTIIDAHMDNFSVPFSDFVDQAILFFKTQRTAASKDPTDNKRISTSELLDFIKAFSGDYEMRKEAESQEELQVEYIASLTSEHPKFLHTLLKSLPAIQRFKKSVS